MTKSTHRSVKITAIVAILFLLPALIFFIIWFSIGMRESGISVQDQMDIYMGYFPKWLQSISIIHIISIAGCVLAIVFASKSFSKKLLWLRLLMMVTVLIGVFLILFNIYQMV